jgi:Ferritin-like
LKYLNGKDPGLFHSDTIKYQFAPGLGYQPRVRDAGGSIVVKDLHSAIKAIDTIVIQGEGSPGPYVDADKLEKDHYDIFLDLKEGDATWNTYPVLENPVTSDYCHLDKRIYQVNRFQYYLLEGLTNEELRRFQSHLMRRIASS